MAQHLRAAGIGRDQPADRRRALAAERQREAQALALDRLVEASAGSRPPRTPPARACWSSRADRVHPAQREQDRAAAARRAWRRRTCRCCRLAARSRTPCSAHSLTSAATSSVEAGEAIASAAPVKRPRQSVSHGSISSGSRVSPRGPSSGARLGPGRLGGRLIARAYASSRAFPPALAKEPVEVKSRHSSAAVVERQTPFSSLTSCCAASPGRMNSPAAFRSRRLALRCCFRRSAGRAADAPGGQGCAPDATDEAARAANLGAESRRPLQRCLEQLRAVPLENAQVRIEQSDHHPHLTPPSRRAARSICWPFCRQAPAVAPELPGRAARSAACRRRSDRRGAAGATDRPPAAVHARPAGAQRRARNALPAARFLFRLLHRAQRGRAALRQARQAPVARRGEMRSGAAQPRSSRFATVRDLPAAIP